MAKSVIYIEEARRLFVEQGLSLDAIVGMLNGKVSRRGLFNWKKEGDWEAKRRAFLEQNQDLHNQIVEIAKLTVREAKARPTAKNIAAMCKAISALKAYEGVKLLEDETTPKDRATLTKEISPDALDYIKKVIYGLK